MTLPRSLLAAGAAALLAAGPARAQDARWEQTATVTGRVVDRTTGEPLQGVRVWFRRLELTAVTDPDGRFRLGPVPIGGWMVAVSRLGYAEVQETWIVDGSTGSFEVALEPNPVALNDLKVSVSRFDRRRRSTGVGVRLVSQENLLMSSAPTVYHLVLDRGVVPTRCPGPAARSALALVEREGEPAPPPEVESRSCVRYRGRPSQVTVMVDEQYMPEGLDALRMYRPGEMYMVEIYGHGFHVRAYTAWYMERMAMRGLQPMPIVF